MDCVSCYCVEKEGKRVLTLKIYSNNVALYDTFNLICVCMIKCNFSFFI